MKTKLATDNASLMGGHAHVLAELVSSMTTWLLIPLAHGFALLGVLLLLGLASQPDPVTVEPARAVGMMGLVLLGALSSMLIRGILPELRRLKKRRA
jgi:hypothetical protein